MILDIDTDGSKEWKDSGYFKAQKARDNYIKEHRPELEKRWNKK